MNHSPDLRLAVTLRLLDGEGQRRFGPGVAALLEQVQTQKSLRAAAGSMGMAYSKAWRIIRTAEEVFGCKMLDSTTGGRHGGGAVLTPEAERLLTAYRAYQADVERYARENFQKSFGFYRTLDREP